MTQTQKNMYRRLLDAKEAELAAGFRRRDEIAVEQTADAIDGMMLAQQRDFAVGQLDRLAVLHREVRDALNRLAAGTYGICLECDEEINASRLAAVPWAAYCRTCQEAIDRGEGSDLAEPQRRWRSSSVGLAA